MLCPLCATDNAATANRCSLCNTVLNEGKPRRRNEEIVLEAKDISTSRRNWKMLALPLVVFVLIVLPWILASELFRTPSDVSEGRGQFAMIKESYFSRQQTWDHQKNQVLEAMKIHRITDDMGVKPVEFRALPLEIFCAYLYDDLNFSSPQFSDFAIHPTLKRDHVLVTLSKVEKGIWPFHKTLSLEVKVKTEHGRLVTDFVTFRRGLRVEPLGLSWKYFGPELQALRQIETFAGGINGFKAFQQNTASGTPTASSLHLSWDYSHRGMTPSRQL